MKLCSGHAGIMCSTYALFNLLVAMFLFDLNPYAAGNYLTLQKYAKSLSETLANRYSSEITQWELSNEYQHDRVWMVS